MTMRLFYGLFALAFILVGCNKELETPIDGIPEGHTEAILDLYGGEDQSEEARAAFYHENGLVKYAMNGITGNIQTRIVRTVIFNGTRETPIYDQNLNWTVSSDGKRLTYTNTSITVKIPDETQELRLYAILADGSATEPTQLQEIKTNQKVEVAVPLVMEAKLKLEKLAGGKKKLTMESSTTAKFKPQGTLMELVIQNNMEVPTFAMGLKVGTAGFNNLQIDNKGKITVTRSNTEKFYGFNTLVGQKEAGIIVVKPNSKTQNRYLIWMPLIIAQNITSVETTGPAKGTAVREKSATKEGQIIKYIVTVDPGNSSLPMYTSSLNMVQYHVDVESNRVLFTAEEFQGEQLEKFKKINANGYLPSGNQLRLYCTDYPMLSNDPLGQEFTPASLANYVSFTKDDKPGQYRSRYYTLDHQDIYSVSYGLRGFSATDPEGRPTPKRIHYRRNGQSITNPDEYAVSFMDYDATKPDNGLKPEDWTNGGNNHRIAVFNFIGGGLRSSLSGRIFRLGGGSYYPNAGTPTSPTSYAFASLGGNRLNFSVLGASQDEYYPVVYFTKDNTF